MALSFHEILLRLLVAAGLGLCIGIERDLHRKPAGMRTSMFVCMATALFTVMSGELAKMWGDTGPTRIASNIVQGIGFLGAGAIIKDNAGFIGLTTAATIFAEAAIGMAAGGGFFGVAAAATGVVIFSLFCLAFLAEWLNLRPRYLNFRFTTNHAESVAQEVQGMLATMKIGAQHFRVSMAGNMSIVEFVADMNHKQEQAIVAQLNREGVTTEVVPAVGNHE